jgi:acyl-CoA dehydrogenase
MSTTPESNAELDLIVETARRILSDETLDDTAMWQRLSQSELLTLAVPEPAGGGWLEAGAAVVRAWAELACAGPLPETMLLAGPVLHAAGLAVPDGRIAVTEAAGQVRRVGEALEVDLAASRVADAQVAEQLVVVVRDGDDDIVISVATDRVAVTPGRNLAGEARDEIHLVGSIDAESWVAAPSGVCDEVRYRGALARAIALSGAAAGALQLTIRYAGERTQFGRPIGRFQVVQHAVAELAVEVEAMSAATAAAVALSAANGFATEPARLAIAVAKSQASAGAGVVAKLAHQVHGAIGTTQEHSLHRLTTRLWSWRDEFGAESAWQTDLGQAALDSDVWQVVT